MCGRMAQFWIWAELRALLEHSPGITADLLDRLLDTAPPAPRAFNLCPGQEPMVVRASSDRLVAQPVPWGIRHRNAGSSSSRVSNARSETVDTKPMFREAFAHARCLVPASGFYEWEPLGPRDKRPWYFAPERDPLCFFAGIIAHDTAAPALAVVTADTPPSAHTKIHHRMPCVILPEHAGAWLGLSGAEPVGPRSCLRAFGSEHAFAFTAHPVSRRVNRVANDSPDLTAPAEPEPGLFG